MTLQEVRENGVEIELEAHIPGDYENATTYKTLVPYVDFEEAVLDWLNGEHKDKSRYEDGHESALNPESYLRFIPEFNHKRHSSGDRILFRDRYSPHLNMEISEHWFVLEWFGTWLVGFRQDATEQYQAKRMPAGLTLDREWNIVGNKVFFSRHEWPWPWPLQNPAVYLPYGRVNFLLQPQDNNPITILCRSPQPYRGFGHMFKTEVEELKRLIHDSL